MGRLVVDVVCLAAVVLSGAHGQAFGHFGTASPPSPSSIESMVPRAVEQQVALQAGACASAWTDRFSSQCPAGAFMALKGYRTTVGLVPIFRCEPTGCLHAPSPGENAFNLRDEGSTMKDAIAKEISKLVEEQPGVSFEKHLAARRKQFGKEGAIVKEVLSALLQEAMLGRPTATTLQFFAELASYRGFAGAVVDNAWAYLHKSHREEMVLVSCREAAKTQAETVTRQEGVISDLKAELAAAHDRERKSAETAAERFSGLSVARDREQKAAEKKLAGLASKLANVQTRLAEERINATAAAQMAAKAAEKTNAEIRAEADASVREAQNESAGLRASLFAAVEAQAVSAKKAEGVAFELASVQMLLAEERNATAALTLDVKAAEGAIARHETAILNVQAELSESKGEVTRLRSQVSEAVDATEAAERESANIRSEADVTRRETLENDNAQRQVIARHEAAILDLQAEMSDSKGEASWLRSQVSEAVEATEAAERENADIHSEADITRRETEMEQRKAKEDMDACTVRADACTFRADACTVRADACTVRLRSTTDKLEAVAGQMKVMLSVSRSLQTEKNTCEGQLASLQSSNDQGDFSGMEVPATADGGSDSTSGAPAP